MSVQAMSWVIEHSPHKGAELLCLLMVANHANASGTEAYPSIETLAKKCRMTERHIRRMLDRLEASGALRIDRGRGRGRHHTMAVVMSSTPQKTGQVVPEKPVKLSEHAEKTGQVVPENRTQLSPRKPDISADSEAPDSSLGLRTRGRARYEPSLEPSLKRESGQIRGGSGKTTAATPARSSPQPGSAKPAVALYCQLRQTSVTSDVADAIHQAVGDDAGKLEHWRAVLHACNLGGVGRGRVDCALDWFRDGIPDRRPPARQGVNGHTSNGVYAPPAAFQRTPEPDYRKPEEYTPEELAASDAERERIAKGIAADIAARRRAARAAAAAEGD